MACFLYQYFYRVSYSKNLLAALSARRGKPGRQTSLPGYPGTTNRFSRQYFFTTSADRFCASDHQSFQNVDWKATRPRQEWHANDCRFWKWTLSFFARRTSLDRRHTGIVFSFISLWSFFGSCQSKVVAVLNCRIKRYVCVVSTCLLIVCLIKRWSYWKVVQIL